jgi:hypothetical protein
VISDGVFCPEVTFLYIMSLTAGDGNGGKGD